MVIQFTEISPTNIHGIVQLNPPPWLFKQPLVILDLNKLTENKTHLLFYQDKLYNIQEKYPHHLHIYTDGPKDSSWTGCGAVFNKKIMKKCLPKEALIFTAEICVINLALKFVSISNSKNILIHSDFISVLQSLKYRKLENPLIVKILKKLNSISHSKNVIFCWIPSHPGKWQSWLIS